MPDEIDRPPPTWIQRLVTSVLPQFIAYSRKGLIWFSSLGAAGVAELCKQAGSIYGWDATTTLQWQNRMLFIQGVLLLVAKFWTDQIAKEDAALKTALPPPAPPPSQVAAGNITNVAAPLPAAPSPTPTVTTTTTTAATPPLPPREGD